MSAKSMDFLRGLYIRRGRSLQGSIRRFRRLSKRLAEFDCLHMGPMSICALNNASISDILMRFNIVRSSSPKD